MPGRRQAGSDDGAGPLLSDHFGVVFAPVQIETGRRDETEAFDDRGLAISASARDLKQEEEQESLDMSAELGTSDPCVCLCNYLRLPRLPAAPSHYILFTSRSGQLYAVGPHWPGLLFMLGLICFASHLFVKRVALELGPGYVLVAYVYTTCTICALVRVALRDPGFVEENTPPTTRRKYCAICHIYTDPLTGHCRACATCVEEWDHHCIWTGHCIGGKNMNAFITLNCIWLTYVVYVLICLLMQSRVAL